jgi:hypothetical protein
MTSDHIHYELKKADPAARQVDGVADLLDRRFVLVEETNNSLFEPLDQLLNVGTGRPRLSFQ